MEYHIDTQVCVIGAGHAGVEAALACSRLGLNTVIFTMNVDSIAMMPCNPHIGGSSKGHLVREIDALGGEMGKNIDKTFIQSKMLNVSKGPAVHSLRTQADKAEYSKAMRQVLEHQENLTIRQAEVTEILTEGRKVVDMVRENPDVALLRAHVQALGLSVKAHAVGGHDFQMKRHFAAPFLNFATTSSMEPAKRKKDSGMSSCLPSMISLKPRIVSLSGTYLPV